MSARATYRPAVLLIGTDSPAARERVSWLEDAGLVTTVCRGPRSGRCPALLGERCPLLDAVDVAIAGDRRCPITFDVPPLVRIVADGEARAAGPSGSAASRASASARRWSLLRAVEAGLGTVEAPEVAWDGPFRDRPRRPGRAADSTDGAAPG